jgi:hypothetical protein
LCFGESWDRQEAESRDEGFETGQGELFVSGLGLIKNLHRAVMVMTAGLYQQLRRRQAGTHQSFQPTHCPLPAARCPLPACCWKRDPKRHATPSMISSCHSNTKAAAAYQGPALSAPESPCVAQSEPRTHGLLSDRFCMQVRHVHFIGSEHAVQYEYSYRIPTDFSH